MQHYLFAINPFSRHYCLPHHQSITTDLLHPLKILWRKINDGKKKSQKLIKHHTYTEHSLFVSNLVVSISLAVVPPFSIHSWQTLSSPKNTRNVHTYSCFSLEDHPQISLLLGFITFMVFNSTNNRSEI